MSKQVSGKLTGTIATDKSTTTSGTEMASIIKDPVVSATKKSSSLKLAKQASAPVDVRTGASPSQGISGHSLDKSPQKLKRTPIWARRPSGEKLQKSPVKESVKSKTGKGTASPFISKKGAEKMSTKVPVNPAEKKGRDLGAIPKVRIPKPDSQKTSSGTLPGSSKIKVKKIQRQVTEEVKGTTMEGTKTTNIKESKIVVQRVFAEASKDLSRTMGKEELDKSLHEKSNLSMSVETGTLKRVTKPADASRVAADMPSTSSTYDYDREILSYTESEEPTSLRILCLDFVDYKRTQINKQHSMETEMRALFPKLFALLKQAESLSVRIHKIPSQIPEDETQLRVENDKLNYLITATASNFKRISALMAVLNDKIDAFTSTTTYSNSGIDERLEKALKVMYKKADGKQKAMPSQSVRHHEDTVGPTESTSATYATSDLASLEDISDAVLSVADTNILESGITGTVDVISEEFGLKECCPVIKDSEKDEAKLIRPVTLEVASEGDEMLSTSIVKEAIAKD